ncbi:MAG TPA: hypothetical protein PKA41_11925, partial [Verrucomicrobiota bacterium]|nr:hypothetical protein [Verrucomicrobiota bacterium]
FTGDSGSGATLGSFEMEQWGIGPVASYLRKFGDKALIVDVKWLPQFCYKDTMNADIVWAKVAFLF